MPWDAIVVTLYAAVAAAETATAAEQCQSGYSVHGLLYCHMIQCKLSNTTSNIQKISAELS
jgi:hypothetical protein